MKTLYLLRHAKALFYPFNNSDKDRPINEEGKREAELVGDILLKKNEIPQLILSSPALRAISTAEIVAKKINYPENEIIVNKNIYEASAEKLLTIIQNTVPKIESLMLVGHNPGISNLLNSLTISDFDYLPTAGLVCLTNSSNNWDSVFDIWDIKHIYKPPKL